MKCFVNTSISEICKFTSCNSRSGPLLSKFTLRNRRKLEKERFLEGNEEIIYAMIALKFGTKFSLIWH